MSRPSIQCWNVARGMVGLIIFACLASSGWGADLGGLKPATFAHYVDRFNTMEDENFTNTIADAEAWDWMQKEIPCLNARTGKWRRCIIFAGGRIANIWCKRPTGGSSLNS